jgi:hypothetical protein
MRIEQIAAFSLVLFFKLISNANAQFLIPGEGIMDVKLGADMYEVEWELGFKGKRIEKDQVDDRMKTIADVAGIDFDYLIQYNHIMWLPVSELLLKDDKVCMVQLSSYPEYNQMLSADIGTMEGLNFWDSSVEIEKIYGKFQIIDYNEKSIVCLKDEGLGMELSNNEIRTMFIFRPN